MTRMEKHMTINYEKPLSLLKSQRSHLLFVLSNASSGQQTEFVNWSKNRYLMNLEALGKVLTVSHFEKHEIDITGGEYEQIDYDYLSVIELSLDGAEQSEYVIDKIQHLYESEPSAEEPAIWLYYPVSEKVGRNPIAGKEMLTLAFANPLPDTDLMFREWYCTRHIRHALNVPELVSGQCLELTGYQKTSMPPKYKMIAVYEQEGTPEQIIESFERLPEETFEFPTLDLVNFAEWVYRPMRDVPSLVFE